MIKLISFFLILTILPIYSQDNWTRFRGKDGRGLSSTTLPKKLSIEKNRSWSIDLKGKGSSSPVIWGDKLFITAKTANGNIRLICLNNETGKETWSQELDSGDYHTHKYNNAAASTPCLTQDALFLPWFHGGQGKVMFSAFSHDGKKLWEKKLGSFESQHGFTANPVTEDNLVIIPVLNKGKSFVSAFDTKTGKEIWKHSVESSYVSYSTPLIRTDYNGKKEVIVTSPAFGTLSIFLKDGKKNWHLPKTFSKRTVNTHFEVQIDGKNFLCASQKGKDFYAVELPSKTNPKPKVFWNERKIGSYVPSFIEKEGVLYIAQDNGALSSYDFKGKKRIDQIKLGADVYSSPVFVKDQLYIMSRFGKLFVVDTKPRLKLNYSLDLNPPESSDWLDATPTPVNNKLYLRLGSRLDCLK
ncbi:MAG: PQQ-binding-like beta-propeller repeat protein [Lentisphaeraceae bacterium]|nr:PQQ-binding-like beta-propeller repeat protein [Lentisphaeraceae bacterium]